MGASRGPYGRCQHNGSAYIKLRHRSQESDAYSGWGNPQKCNDSHALTSFTGSHLTGWRLYIGQGGMTACRDKVSSATHVVFTLSRTLFEIA